MTDSHVHLYPHQFPDRPHLVTPPDGPYPLRRVEEFVSVAARRGVTELAFTEHFYRCVESGDVLGPFWEQDRGPVAERTRLDVLADRRLSLERYVDVILRAKGAGLPVLLGLEVDFFPDSIEAVMEFLSPYPFDVLIGSVHWIGGFGFDKPHSREEWDRRGHRYVYEQFFELESEMAGLGLVDVIAHPDRIKMSSIRLDTEPTDLYEALVAAAVRGGAAMELNSGGLRHPVAEVYPTRTLLEMSAAAGLDLTLASDAHEPEGAGWKLDEMRVIAGESGFTHLARFEKRRKILEPIEMWDDTGRSPS